ncbi:MAG: hypothetical protein PHI59_02350 [Candidatus Omnitrophica bacterium]|nr:hypothetical protein [Candidatus Omnitrophota bacterium]
MYYPKKNTGMTLVEVITSLMLITLVIGGFLGLLLENIKAGETIDYNYVAINIAKSRMDRIRELRRDKGFSYLSTATENDTTVDRNGLPDVNGDFTRTTAISTSFAGKPNLTKVTVTVKYKRLGDVSTTTITLTSLISPYI